MLFYLWSAVREGLAHSGCSGPMGVRMCVSRRPLAEFLVFRYGSMEGLGKRGGPTSICPFPHVSPPHPFSLSFLSFQVPKVGSLPLTTEVIKSLPAPPALEKKPQVAYKTEIIGGVVVHTPINQVLGPGAAGRRWGYGSIHSGRVTCTEEASTEDRWLGVGSQCQWGSQENPGQGWV